MTKPERIARAGALVLAPRRDLCLDFANTLAWRGSAPSETLHGLPDLMQWAASSGSLLAGAIDGHGAGEARPGRSAIRRRLRRFFSDDRDWETIYRIFHAVASGGAPGDDDLLELNRALQETPARSALQRIGAGLRLADRGETAAGRAGAASPGVMVGG